jgi:hypothetical protein
LREEVVGYITNINIATETGVTFDTGYELSPLAPLVNLSLLRQDKDKNWARQGAMPFASFRKASQKVQFHFPRCGQVIRSIGDEWLCFSNGEKFTNESLGYLADTFPMPVEQFREDKNPYDVTPSGAQSAKAKPARYWYPTLVLNLDIKKALPEEGVEWLFGRVRAKLIKNGRMDSEVVAVSMELVVVFKVRIKVRTMLIVSSRTRLVSPLSGRKTDQETSPHLVSRSSISRRETRTLREATGDPMCSPDRAAAVYAASLNQLRDPELRSDELRSDD